MNILPRSCLFCLALGLTVGCATHGPVGPIPADPECARIAASARAALGDGRADAARTLLQDALRRADALDDMRTAANLALSLAVVQFQTGELTAASETAADAAARAVRIGASPAAAEQLRARIALTAGNPDLASAACDAAETAKRTPMETAEQAVLRSEIAAARGDSAEADRFAQEAERRMPKDAPAVLRARAEARTGARWLPKNPDAAARAFEREAAAWRQARHAAGVSSALHRAADAWRKADQQENAADADLRAARSLAAQGGK